MKYINLEYHPMDSRIKIVDDEVCQTLNTRMGTGGNNVPLVLAIHEADGQDVTMQEDVGYALVTGGGKPGQGYPCVLVTYEDIVQQSKERPMAEAECGNGCDS